LFLSKDTAEAFAKSRNKNLSFPFLKENGELISIAATSGMLMEPIAREFYKPIYFSSSNICEAYPQYFRFILRLILDLEDMGMGGQFGLQICQYVRREGYLLFETSDTRRLEILTLLSRRLKLNEVELKVKDKTLSSVQQFISSPKFYTRLNKPLFYDLTHVIFFLTDYGNMKWPLDKSVHDCLLNIGVLAFLDDDLDLLAEVCICLKFLKKDIPLLWKNSVEDSLSTLKITYDTDVHSSINASVDEYHPYLVSNWLLALNHAPCFTEKFGGRTPNFILERNANSALSEISNLVHARKITNPGALEANVSHQCQSILTQAYNATPNAANLVDRYSFGQITQYSLMG